MKYVYVLVSSENDYYAEEALVSMYSLKKYNPTAEIILILDKNTFDSLKGIRGKIHEYVDEFVMANTPLDYMPIQKSRFLKTSLRKYIIGDFLYIDNDTLITGDLSELENFEIELGAVYDNHRNDWNEQMPFPMVKEYYKCLGYERIPFYNITHHFNGGLIYSKDTPLSHKLYSRWHELWLEGSIHGFHSDQPTLWLANLEMQNPIIPINGIYNCQVPYYLSLKFLEAAKIVHYFSSYNIFQGFFLQDKKILKYIKTNGIDPKIIRLIDNAKQNFWENIVVVKGTELNIYNSANVVLARKLSRDFPWTNKLSKFFYRLFGYKI